MSLSPQRSRVIGWDVGGAHLKAALVENGRVLAWRQAACRLWLGIDRLDAAFSEIEASLGFAEAHAFTMTGELADAFEDRAQGVAAILDAAERGGFGSIRVYAGARGFLDPQTARREWPVVASANWRASADWAARAMGEGVFVDVGSTTTDIVPFARGRVAARGTNDLERLACGELLYTGASRTPLMAIVAEAPFRGAWRPLCAEHFATTADLWRLLGEIPEGDSPLDLQPSADGRGKSLAESRARLARMLGADAADGAEADWRRLARWLGAAQLHAIHRAAALALSRGEISDEAPVIGVGAGDFLARRLAERLERPYVAGDALFQGASTCAPAAAVALLAGG